MSLEAHHRFILDTLQRNQDIAQNIINKLEAENARLKAEVERLRASSFVTAVPVEQYERVIKAGNAMVLKVPDMMAGCVRAEEAVGLMNDWIAAKKGKQP